MAAFIKYGPRPTTCRSLRWLETSPDNYVQFAPKQRLWAFSHRHPALWSVYRAMARIRCAILGHEYSAIWEADKFVADPKTRTYCLFCGSELVAVGGDRGLSELVDRLTALLEAANPDDRHPPLDVFQSTIQPDRWYVARGRLAILATEVGASGEREATLAAEAINALPRLMLALALRDAEITRLRSAN